ncbi:hypothetical protein [Pannonibacter phragmitetus]|uniref:Uncharacterized protein n=1 Tax=Pannonibacter phragmitetus TaxID=121719 RepID=A0A0U3P5K6_9HYPH|nr:hypothetical protein [Pannonibacter phragmitetus]ALV28950.1 hypothetical protein APZ00_19460 [Pannonibacter phragmitetus]
MTSTARPRRPAPRPVSNDAPAYLYKVGQDVRLNGGSMERLHAAGVYRITARLPIEGDTPKYRIRSEDERHERVASQDTLVPAGPASGSADSSLLERTFRHG